MLTACVEVMLVGRAVLGLTFISTAYTPPSPCCFMHGAIQDFPALRCTLDIPRTKTQGVYSRIPWFLLHFVKQYPILWELVGTRLCAVDNVDRLSEMIGLVSLSMIIDTRRL